MFKLIVTSENYYYCFNICKGSDVAPRLISSYVGNFQREI